MRPSQAFILYGPLFKREPVEGSEQFPQPPPREEEVDDETSVPESPLKKPKIEGSSDEQEEEDSEEEEEDDEDGITEEEKNRFRAYQAQILQYQGFHVDRELLPLYCWGKVIPTDLESNALYAIFIDEGARLAVDHHNATDENPKLEFVRVIKANSSQATFYVTFEAKDLSSGNTATYQTVVTHYGSDGNNRHTWFTFIRPELEHHKIVRKKKAIEVSKVEGDVCGTSGATENMYGAV